MQNEYYHGSSDYFEEFIPEGKCVTRSMSYARHYARRKRNGIGYIYFLQLDPHTDLKAKAVETDDWVLAKPLRFCKRIPLTKELNDESDTEIARITAPLKD